MGDRKYLGVNKATGAHFETDEEAVGGGIDILSTTDETTFTVIKEKSKNIGLKSTDFETGVTEGRNLWIRLKEKFSRVLTAAYTFDTAGFPYYLKGLVDRTSNSAFNKIVVIDPTTGEKGLSDKGIEVTLPEGVATNFITNYTITVNNAMPSPAPTLPTYQQDLQNFMNTLYTHDLIPFNGPMSFYSLDDSPFQTASVINNSITIRPTITQATNLPHNTPILLGRCTDLRLPNNKNWVVKFAYKSPTADSYQIFRFGFSGENTNGFFTIEKGLVLLRNSAFSINEAAYQVGSPHSIGFLNFPLIVYFIKLGDFIHIVLNYVNTPIVKSINAEVTTYATYVPTVELVKFDASTTPFVSQMSYWIEP